MKQNVGTHTRGSSGNKFKILIKEETGTRTPKRTITKDSRMGTNYKDSNDNSRVYHNISYTIN